MNKKLRIKYEQMLNECFGGINHMIRQQLPFKCIKCNKTFMHNDIRLWEHLEEHARTEYDAILEK